MTIFYPVVTHRIPSGITFVSINYNNNSSRMNKTATFSNIAILSLITMRFPVTQNYTAINSSAGIVSIQVRKKNPSSQFNSGTKPYSTDLPAELQTRFGTTCIVGLYANHKEFYRNKSTDSENQSHCLPLVRSNHVVAVRKDSLNDSFRS